jgi:hypothetical protein
MKVQMLRNKMGSNDGVTTKMYNEGETYEVSEDLGTLFLRDKDAEIVSDDAVETAPAYVEGGVYFDEDGKLFIGGHVDGKEGIALLPIDQITEAERAALVTEGKLNADGTAVEAKAIEAAPKNKAISKAPKNKAK